VRYNFGRALGITLAILVLAGIFSLLTIAANKVYGPPVIEKPDVLVSLERWEGREFDQLLVDALTWPMPDEMETIPPVDPDAPPPASTRLYNNQLENLLSSLHYFYRLSGDDSPSEYVIGWDPEDGGRVVTTATLFSIETNISYLLTLEMYRKMHAKAVFDEDLEYARKVVDDLFAMTWRTALEWPLGPYFDLVALYDLTGNEKYLEYSRRYGGGDGINDYNTPLTKARTLAVAYQRNRPGNASPFYFLHAALLADWGKRYDPSMVDQARTVFRGLRRDLLDTRYNLFWKQSSTAGDGSGAKTVIQTFDSLEQLTAVRAILLYAKSSSDPEGLALGKAVMEGIWDEDSPLQYKPPADLPQSAFWGIYTAYDMQREAERLDTGERTIIHVLLLEDMVLLNELTRGEYRGEVDFLSQWMEDSGPLYDQQLNGFYTLYKGQYEPVEGSNLDSKSAIWMARALVQDEWYRYRSVRDLTEIAPEEVQVE
jgi:hypothetical protein